MRAASCRRCFFFQAADGIRGLTVTGVQTCALPIWLEDRTIERHARAQCRVIANLLELARPGGAAANEPLLSGVRVLVAGVDGEGRALQNMLAVAGAEVRLASSAEDALGTVGSWHPDVLLSDLGNGGDSLIRELRALPAERGQIG